jgi:23S rRNA A2030 N6-methylase RlmJ
MTGCGETWTLMRMKMSRMEDRVHAFEAADQDQESMESDNEMTDSQRIRAFDGYDDDSYFNGFYSDNFE